MKNIFIYENDDKPSINTSEELIDLLKKAGFNVEDQFSKNVDLVISIGGDGTFLRALRSIGFASVPVLGINTGHLGFFTEFIPSELSDVVSACTTDCFIYEEHKLINTKVYTETGATTLTPALNDALVERNHSSLIHLDLYLGEHCVESSAGDGLLVSSSAGSTAYNYSLGGSIIDPRLNLLQVTPMAPVNNASYRNLTSSLLVPQEEKVIIVPMECKDVNIVIDGDVQEFTDVEKIEFSLSNNKIKIARLPGFNFWKNVKEKFL